MKDGFALLVVTTIIMTLAKLWARGRGGAVGGSLSWAAGGSNTDRDPGSDRRMVQRVGALNHSAILCRIIQTECGGRARHLEHITERTHMEQAFTFHETKSKTEREQTCSNEIHWQRTLGFTWISIKNMHKMKQQPVPGL